MLYFWHFCIFLCEIPSSWGWDVEIRLACASDSSNNVISFCSFLLPLGKIINPTGNERDIRCYDMYVSLSVYVTRPAYGQDIGSFLQVI